MLLNAGMREPGCFKCHTDKRGPFTFEHAPVRLEGCPACHQPHGSANPRMLTRHEVRFQCLECHSNVTAAAGAQAAPSGGLGAVPPAFHDLRNPRYRNCTTCHWKIHGSHVNREFTR
jgi:DmsE family decaheme c-type cytochrome